MTGHARRGLRARAAILLGALAATLLGLTASLASAATGLEVGALDRIPKALPGAPALTRSLRVSLAAELASRGDEYVPRTRNRRGDGSPLYSNRLLLEKSPYLQQHAHNPVNWYPWGDEAFETAKKLGLPVLVSIGYSTCHWCHVMEEESFDTPEIAALLNRGFIAVKVDRELRPDIDAIYMTAIHAMGKRGGWPLNVFVTADRKPFFGGTYFPPRDRGGQPGFPSLLKAIREQFESDPQRIEETAKRIEQALQRELEGREASASHAPSADILKQARSDAGERMDVDWGGQRGSPKFPSGMPLRFLLRYARRSGDSQALWMATFTLEKMAAGGMYDQAGGGFHRYSTDPFWRVPHFEKMLYDNAQLASTYVEAWQATGDEIFERIAREILRYVEREMTAREGGFYSASDADNLAPSGEREEGAFFTWTAAEIESAVGSKHAAILAAYYGVTEQGNFEGRNVLFVSSTMQQVAMKLGVTFEEVQAAVRAGGELLYRVRARRNPPHRDDKVLVAWNGLMISAFAKAGFAFHDPRYIASASRAARFVLENMRVDGRLRRVFVDGSASGPAFLEDYAFLIQSLLDLYEASQELGWLREALALQAVLDAHYLDESGGGYFKTADDGERLLAREKPGRDGAIPSGNSVQALNLLRLAEYSGDDAHRAGFEMLYSAFHETLTRNPGSLFEMLLAIDYRLDTTKEIVLVRPERGGDLDAMLAPLRAAFVPNRILAVTAVGEEMERKGKVVPLVKNRVARAGEVTAYVCQKRVCLLPTSDPEVFAEQISAVDALMQ